MDSVADSVTLDRPRDLAGEFDSVIVPKGTQTMGGVDDMILSLYAKGMTTRDIAEHLHTTYGTEISHEKVSTIVEAIDTTVKQWRNRPSDEVYPIVYLDAIWCEAKESGRVVKEACRVALGVDLDGTISVLGLWLHGAESASAWAAALIELHNRGVQDLFVVCCDGLPGAVTATWSHATVQSCVVHLIRNSLRYAS